MFIVRLKNYLAKWLELSGNSSEDFNAIVDLKVKEQFINTCCEELAVYLLERGPKDLLELATWAQQYLIVHKQKLGASLQSSLKCALQRRQTQSKLHTTQGRQRSLQCYRCKGMATDNQNV